MAAKRQSLTLSALFLYLRSGVAMGVQLLSVRYLLLFLGDDGYGLYGLIASIVAIVAALKGLFSASIQRFINIAIGEKRFEDIPEIFNASIIIFFFVALLLASVTMGIGAIMMPHLVIPEFYMNQVWWVLLFSSLSLAIDLFSVPYTAMLTAFEKFKQFAWLSILESFLKLGVVFLLLFFPTYKVAVYAGLLLLVSLAVRLTYMLVCRHYFRELIKFRHLKNKAVLKEMSVFAGFKSIGTLSNTVLTSCINFILNIFGGLIINASRTVAYQVMGAVNVLVWNINIAFIPRITTLYGERNHSEYFALVLKMTRMTFLINLIMGFCLSVLIRPILNLWLSQIPPFAPEFICFIFLYAIAKSLIDSIDAVFSAEGKVKWFQFLMALATVITLALVWWALHAGLPLYWAFIIMAAVGYGSCVMAFWLAARQTSFDVKKLVAKILLPTIGLLLSFSTISYLLQQIIPEKMPFGLLMLAAIALIASCGIPSLFAVFGKTETLRLGKQFIILFGKSR